MAIPWGASVGSRTLALLMQSRLEIASTLDGLRVVLDWFDQFQTLPIPQIVWMQCQVALIEGFTNAVRHAHRGLPPETLVEVEAIAQSDSLTLRVWDRGPGFNFEATLKNKVKAMSPDNEGGRGLSIMGKVADEVQYLTEEPAQGDRRNCLQIHKVFSPLLSPNSA